MAERICILLRHGDYHQLANTPSAHQPFGLTTLGRKQASDAAAKVLRMADDHGWLLHPNAHSSSLLRAWETADIALRGLPDCKHLVQTDRLAERCVGSGANLSRQQIAEVVAQDRRLGPLPDDWQSNSRFRLPFVGAESLMESGERVASYLSEAMETAEANQAILFFGHGASFRHAAHQLGVLPFDQLAVLSMHHADPVALSISADGSWRHRAGAWKKRVVESKPTD